MMQEQKAKLMDLYLNKKIEIIDMQGEPRYCGKQGIVMFIDDMLQFHGTWGGLALNLSDSFRIIE